MPHSESTTLTNGDSNRSSQFLNHLSSYPVVSDTISAYKSNPYGAKSLEVAANAQAQFIDPVLASKQAQQASSYIHPYAAKVDGLGESGLRKVESRFPLITKDTATVRDTLLGLALAPITLPLGYARWGYDWVNQTYAQEVKSNGGDAAAHGKAVLTTGLVAVGESAAWIRQFLAKVEKEGENKFGELKDQATKTGQDVKNTAEKKGQEAKDAAGKKGEQAKKEINGKA